MSKKEQVMLLDPPYELRFKGPFNDVITSYLKLTNPSEKRVCFKVKTTAPKRYCVRPNNGIVEPKSSVTVAVMLQPFDYDPNEKNKHKFMVQTMFSPDGDINQETLWRDVSPDALMDSKLKCVFDLPAENSAQNNLDVTQPASDDKMHIKSVEIKPSPKVLRETDKNYSRIASRYFLWSYFTKYDHIINADQDFKRLLEESKRLEKENSTLRQENIQLKEETLRLRRQNESRGIMGSSDVPAKTITLHQLQQSSGPTSSSFTVFVIVAIVGAILGLILGRVI